ncbi:MAG: carbon-nitrogen hydrolase family protein [Planctomycetes bacterium]|nr:carbon-nitrogen hydrolase family protein [Planctomycetota bacterium]
MSAPAASAFDLALIQAPAPFLRLAAGLERAAELVHAAAESGASLVVFPETWLLGYPLWVDLAPRAACWGEEGARELHQALLENAVSLGDASFERLLSISRETGVHLAMGLHERFGGTLYNTLLFCAPDETWAIRRKLVPTHGERLVWGRGDGSTLEVFESELGRLGGLICWEHWMPLLRAAMQAQRETLHIAQWPSVKDLHLMASRTYAFEARCYVAAAGCAMQKGALLEGSTLPAAARGLFASIPGDDDAWVLDGGSTWISPEGDVIGGPIPPSAPWLLARYEPGAIERALLTFDGQGHYARPDVFELHVDTRPRPLVRFEP